MLKLLTAFALFIALCLPLPAQASSQSNLLPNYDYAIYFVRKEGTPANLATLRVTQALSLNGCAKITSPTVEIRKDPPYYWVTMGNTSVTVDQSVRYPHYECDGGPKSLETDIAFDRDELARDQVKTVAIKTDLGREDLEVHLHENKLELMPKSSNPKIFKPHEVGAREEPLTHWFYPKNVVILSVPMAPEGLDLREEIKDLAYKKGFMDLSALLVDFKNPLSTPNTLYFVDQVGTFAEILELEETNFMGTITTSETLHGPNGPYERAKDLHVHMRRPGLLD